MAEKKPFLLRVDPEIHEALRRWADDELRSLNGQIEFVLRRSLESAGRLKAARRSPPPSGKGPEESLPQ
ncbi:MAG: hypothetical protein V1774_06600 [Candidatus Eisenbacteria bacterium]